MISQKKLQSTISKTKKRLSSPSVIPLFLAFVFVLISTLSLYSFRIVTAGSAYSYVPASIPVAEVPLNDNANEVPPQQPGPALESATPVVVLTAREFIFGDSASFTDDITNVRNKFRVAHIDGQPQLPTLVKKINDWDNSRKSRGGVLIFYPSDEIPMPIVLQVMAGIRASSAYKRIILAGGLM